LIVAAWQAYIEKLSLETLDLIEQSIVNRRKPAPAWIRSAFYFRSPAVRQSIGALNTPNSENVVKLLEFSFGLNPKSYWTWTGRRTWSAQEFCNRTNEWLRIRHTIAHGNGLPDNLTWLKNDSGTARLNLNLLKEAKRHFEKLASLTDKAMCDHLNNQYAVKCRWYR
jgi:hypothetical protein